MSTYTDASLIVTPNAYKAGKLYSLKPTEGTGDLDVVRATTATYVGSDGLIKTALANEVRFDYTNGSCPSILVEPQRTNLFLRSEEFDNAYWTKTGTTTPIITANSTSSPDGTMTADLFTGTGGLGQRLQRVNTLSLSTPYSISVFLKANTATTATINVFDGSTDRSATLTFSTGAVSISGSGITASVINFTNGWYRLVVNYQSFATTAVNTQFSVIGSSSYFIWGAQLEVGANATSYIPTVASAVTRNADVISKTGIADLIGQVEGTIFFDGKINALPVDGTLFGIQKNASNFVIRFGSQGKNIYAQSYNGSANLFFEATSYTLGSRVKAAFAYKAGSYAFYINGVQIATGSNATAIPACDSTMLNSLWGNFKDSVSFYNVNALWKTRLSNTELSTLTTI